MDNVHELKKVKKQRKKKDWGSNIRSNRLKAKIYIDSHQEQIYYKIMLGSVVITVGYLGYTIFHARGLEYMAIDATETVDGTVTKILLRNGRTITHTLHKLAE